MVWCGDNGTDDTEIFYWDGSTTTIITNNSGAIPATQVTLTDNLPNNTTYIADSLRRNGLSIGSDGGVLPLIVGLLVNSDDDPGAGIVTPGASAEITFEVQVNVAGAVLGGVVDSGCRKVFD